MVSLVIWGVNQISVQALSLLEWTVQLVISRAVCSLWKDKHSSPSLPQFSLKPLHTVTCGELWSGNKTKRPVRLLSCMWGRCIDLRALLLHCTKQRRAHYTMACRLVLFWSSSLWKGLKASVSLLAVTSSIHLHTENKFTQSTPSSLCFSNVALWCERRWHALLMWQIFRPKAKVCVWWAKREVHSSEKTAQDAHPPSSQQKPCAQERCAAECVQRSGRPVIEWPWQTRFQCLLRLLVMYK